ncbi:MAG: methyltransferase [Chitinophagaceae bacterium]|nr:MAG: methyltransferase [Chitinophagaceae bacterium]
MSSTTVATPPVLTPARILETGLAFWPSKVLLTAVKLDLFTILSKKKKTAEEIRTELNLHTRGVYDFLDTLVALQFLHREGYGQQAIYGNTPETSLFLNRAEPSYVGGMLIMANDRLYPFWNNLEEALVTGKPQNESKNGEGSLFEALYADENRLEGFVAAMGSFQVANFSSFARQFDFSPYRTHCDIGGAGGHFAAQIVTYNPSIQSTSFDLPAVENIARRNLRAMNVNQNVEVASGDFFKDPFPAADVITMGNILHDWDLPTKKMLIKKAYDALPTGGAFAVIENVIDDKREKNAFGLMMSLNMLIETDGGFDYTGADFLSWTKEAGFRGMKLIHLNGPTSALVAYK